MLVSLALFTNGLSSLVTLNEGSRGKTDYKTKTDLIQNKEPGTGSDRPPITGNAEDKEDVTYGNPVNMIVFGLDEDGVRSDVIILLNYDPKSGGLNILSIARDTRVRAMGKTMKVNAVVPIGGEEMAVSKIEEITGLPVNYYMTLNFAGFRKIVDILGGVEFEIPFDMDYDDPEQNLHIHLQKGMQVLNGKKAEQLVRYRKGYTNGDLDRIKMQQDFVKALIEQKMKLKYLSKAADIFYTLKRYMRTNIEIEDINGQLRNMKRMKYDDIKAYTIPGDSVYVDNVWYFIYDREKTKELIDSSFFK